MNLLTKQEVMQLFTIRDRTFYSWIEKGLLVSHDVGNQKKYDVTKALDTKNLTPDDVGSLLARPAEVTPDTPAVDPIANRQQNLEMQSIQNLKSQLEVLTSDLKDERKKNMTLVSKLDGMETGQKLLGEIRANENQMMDLAKRREDQLVLAFQEQVKEIILINKESDNEHFQQLIQKINQGQTEREKSLKGITKFVSISALLLIIVVSSVFIVTYINQNNSLELTRKQKDDLLEKAAKDKEELDRKHTEMLLKAQEKYDQEFKSILSNYDEKSEKLKIENQRKIDELKQEVSAEKTSQKEFYERQAKLIETQLSRMINEKDEAVKSSNELKLQIKILELKINNVLNETIEKNKDSKTSKELEVLKSTLLELQNSLNNLEQKKVELPKTLLDAQE